MKTKIEFNVDIDVDAWVLNFGMDKSEVRDDVKEHARQMFIEYLVDQQLGGAPK